MLSAIIDIYDPEITKWTQVITFQVYEYCCIENDIGSSHTFVGNDVDFECIVKYDESICDAPTMTLSRCWLHGDIDDGEETATDLTKYNFMVACDDKFEDFDHWNEEDIYSAGFNELLHQFLKHPDWQFIDNIWNKEAEGE